VSIRYRPEVIGNSVKHLAHIDIPSLDASGSHAEFRQAGYISGELQTDVALRCYVLHRRCNQGQVNCAFR